MCLLRLLVRLKLSPHVVHLYGFSPVCILMCVLRCPVLLKAFPHVVHVCGFSPVCLLMCLLRLLVWLKLFPHVLHEYGFSSVCIFVIVSKCPAPVMIFPFVLFSPECIIVCKFRCSTQLKLLLHVQQVYGVSLFWSPCVALRPPSSMMCNAGLQMFLLSVSFSAPLFFLGLGDLSWYPVVNIRMCLVYMPVQQRQLIFQLR